MKRVKDISGKCVSFFTIAWLILVAGIGSAIAITFKPNESITPLDQLAKDQQRPNIAVDAAGNAFAVWEEKEAGKWVLFYSRKPAGGNWGPKEKINDNVIGLPSSARIAVHTDGDVYVIWNDTRDGDSNIYFSKRTNGTGVWSTNVKVNDDAGAAYQGGPSIAVDNSGNAYAVWQDNREGNGDIYFSKRTNGTGAWSDNVKVNDDTGNAGQGNPSIAVDTFGTAYAVWQDGRDGVSNDYGNIYSSRRNNGNGIWSTNIRVNDDAGIEYQSHPSIAVDTSGNAYAAWVDCRNSAPAPCDIYFSKWDSVDGIWIENQMVNEISANQRVGAPSIAVDVAGNAFVAWRDNRNSNVFADIYFSYRSAAGGIWGTNEKVNDGQSTPNFSSINPRIAVDGTGKAYAVWDGDRYGTLSVCVAERPSGGPWGTNAKITNDPSIRQVKPHLGVDNNGNAQVLWLDARNGFPWGTADVYSSLRATGGSWGNSTMVENPPQSVLGLKFNPDMSLAVNASGTAYAVWPDIRNSMTSGLDIYFSYRMAGGDWQTNEKVNDNNLNTNQDFPAIALEGNGTVYAIWRDWRDGGPNLYFSYRPAGGSWQTNEQVNDVLGKVNWGNNDVHLPHPSLAVDPNGNAYAVWVDGRNGKLEIYFSHRTAGGPWQQNVKVNDTTTGSCQMRLHPSIGVDSHGNAYAVWEDYRNGNDQDCAVGITANKDIYFSYRPANGTWQPNVKVNDDPGSVDQHFPSIAVLSDGRAYAAWADNRNNNNSFFGGGGGDIYFSYRPAGGVWGTNVKVTDESTFLKSYPSITVDQRGVPYVAWEDNRYTTTNIMFSSFTSADYYLYLPLIIKLN